MASIKPGLPNSNSSFPFPRSPQNLWLFEMRERESFIVADSFRLSTPLLQTNKLIKDENEILTPHEASLEN